MNAAVTTVAIAQLAGSSHRRLNPLTGEWVLVSPQRTQRPWQGAREHIATAPVPPYQPECYLCPGNVRINGVRNPSYSGTFVFANDFPALIAASSEETCSHPLFSASAVTGECRVVCYSPRHDISLGRLPLQSTTEVIQTWVEEWTHLAGKSHINSVQIFENRGEMMGASNPHPHGQIWATSVLPNEIEKELKQQRAYFEQHGRPLLLDYVDHELALGERIVWRGPHWVALVPFWAVWPFELMVVPTHPITGFDQLTADSEVDLASLLRQVACIYDCVFDVPFPYSMGWHARPCDDDSHPEWQLHAHFYPPLLRSASVRKFQVGFELLGMPQRDLTAESAAEVLRQAARLAGEAS
jgi:UDPglucose--hexose-1-phosphate uridylyltransferase